MKKVLVIDDEIAILQLMTLMLERLGWEAICAMNGREALQKLETCIPDLIITDVIMPDMEGIELIRRIRKSYPEVSTVVMSGDPVGSQFLKTAELFGAGATIGKPFTMLELETAIRMATEI